MTAQYSIPFCVALSLYDDPMDPGSFDENRVKDQKILAMTRRVKLKIDDEIEQRHWDRAARVTVRLKDGRRFTALIIHFRGAPKNPLSHAELEGKARRLTKSLLSPQTFNRLVESVFTLEKVKKISALSSLFRGDR
jgi:2-methylcitrate dehydratase PrpD